MENEKYTIQLASQLDSNQAHQAAQQLGEKLRRDPEKLEQKLRSGGTLGTTKTKERAEEIAQLFRDAGLEIQVVAPAPTSTSSTEQTQDSTHTNNAIEVHTTSVTTQQTSEGGILDLVFNPLDSALNTKTDRNLWKQWALYSTIGGAIGGFVGVFLGTVLFYRVWEFSLIQFFIGAGIGTGQWLILRHRVPWISSSIINKNQQGWVQPWITFSALSVMISNGLEFFGLIGGAILGIAQWSMMRKYYHQAWAWIAVSAVGWEFANRLDLFLFRQMRDRDIRSLSVWLTVEGAVMGGITALLTGVVLSWLINKRQKQDADTPTQPQASGA
jgi:hypothetical protein